MRFLGKVVLFFLIWSAVAGAVELAIYEWLHIYQAPIADWKLLCIRGGAGFCMGVCFSLFVLPHRK